MKCAEVTAIYYGEMTTCSDYERDGDTSISSSSSSETVSSFMYTNISKRIICGFIEYRFGIVRM